MIHLIRIISTGSWRAGPAEAAVYVSVRADGAGGVEDILKNGFARNRHAKGDLGIICLGTAYGWQ